MLLLAYIDKERGASSVTLALLYPLVGFQQGRYSACEVSYIYRKRKIFRWDFPHFATNPMEKFEYPYFLRNFAKRKNTIC